MPTQITSAGITFNDATSLTSANGVPSAIKLTTARTINGVAFDGTANITVPASGTSAAKAWVNFNGTGTIGVNQTIRSSYNVSSVSKTASGEYTINFTSPMTDSNYAIAGAANDNFLVASGYPVFYLVSQSQSSFSIATGQSTGNNADATIVTAAVFGN